MKPEQVEIKVLVQVNGGRFGEIMSKAERSRSGEMDPEDAEPILRSLVESVTADAVASLDLSLSLKKVAQTAGV